MTSYKQWCVVLVLIVQLHTKASEDIPITLVTNALQQKAVCMDGSPAGYHYASGYGEGLNSWLIHLMGGAWCGTGKWCNQRIRTELGSTINVTTKNFEGILSSNQTINPDFFNWHRVFVHYCDSSSFLGDTEVTDNGTNFQLRGSRVFDAVVNDLLAKGMRNAKNAILTGASAGGLASMLHCDSFRTLLYNVDRVKCIADSGFFIQASNVPYARYRNSIFAQTIIFHNLTSFLPITCTSRRDPKLCFFPKYLIGYIKTPIFLLNSVFDSVQIGGDLQPDAPDLPGWDMCIYNLNKCTLAQKQVIKDFRNAFFEEFKEIGNNTSRGVFINACYSHIFTESNALWNSKNSPRLQNKTISQSIGDWYFDRTPVEVIDTISDFALNCTVS